MSQSFTDIFIEEGRELVSDIVSSLLELEQDPENTELVARIFRSLHTIKGSGAMFGLDTVSDFAHHLEDLFDRVRNNRLKLDKDIIDLTLSSADLISKMLDSAELTPEVIQQKEEIVRRIENRLGANSIIEEEEKSKAEEEKNLSVSGARQTFRIVFTPGESVFRQGVNTCEIFSSFRTLGDLLIIAKTTKIPDLFHIDPEVCYLAWVLILTTDQGIDSIQDITMMLDDYVRIQIDMIDDGSDESPDPDYKKLGDILIERGDINREEMNRALSMQHRFGEILVSQGAVQNEAIESALMEQKHIRQLRQTAGEKKEVTSLRVSSDKVDILVNLVGELVTLQARLNQLSNQRIDSELLGVSEEMERLTAELRDHTMDIRMFPIGSTFSQFRRLVRDLSAQLGKEIELSTEGDETELDKSVIEKLHDPLVHLIRNSIDHGVESPEQRLEKGKSRQGMVHLGASQSGGFVVIQISDDGRGLDVEAIRDKAVERGLIQQDTQLNEQKVYNLIFEPGFSTAKQVSDLSGRGVGMDVVKRNIEALRGSVQVESEVDIGTTVTIKIPLTLAIIDGLLVQVGAERYVIPLALVEECVEIRHSRIVSDGGNRLVKVRGALVPYIYLHEIFEHDEPAPDYEQIIIIRNENRRVGLVVDQVIGGHQTVIKNLGAYLKKLEGVSGATILGDGGIALILDIPCLVKQMEEIQLNRSRDSQLSLQGEINA